MTKKCLGWNHDPNRTTIRWEFKGLVPLTALTIFSLVHQIFTSNVAILWRNMKPDKFVSFILSRSLEWQVEVRLAEGERGTFRKTSKRWTKGKVSCGGGLFPLPLPDLKTQKSPPSTPNNNRQVVVELKRQKPGLGAHRRAHQEGWAGCGQWIGQMGGRREMAFPLWEP